MKNLWHDFKSEALRELRYIDTLEWLILVGCTAVSIWLCWDLAWWKNALITFFTIAMAWVGALLFFPAQRE